LFKKKNVVVAIFPGKEEDLRIPCTGPVPVLVLDVEIKKRDKS
jgi:hypothetical protein